jgi:hypothetical protein
VGWGGGGVEVSRKLVWDGAGVDGIGKWNV